MLALFALFFGRAAVKRALAEIGPIDPVALPYRRKFLSWLRREHASGRQIVLATAAHETVARQVADHLQIFDRVLASDGFQNNKGSEKLATIERSFPGRDFDYCGDSRADLPLFQAAQRAYLVGAGNPLTKSLSVEAHVDLQFARAEPGPKRQYWLQAIRPRHWLKNLLVLMPFFSAFLVTDTALLINAVMAAIAMCLAASSGYVINDLLDMQADRHHPRKFRRPFAMGRLTAAEGFAAALLLQLGALMIALMLGWAVLAWIMIYLLGTFSYCLLYTSPSPRDRTRSRMPSSA